MRPGSAPDPDVPSDRQGGTSPSVAAGAGTDRDRDREDQGDRHDHRYFRQLLAGRDFARDDPLATQMVNFVYLVGDRAAGEAVIVDPAYAVDELLELLAADGMACVGAVATHYHPDHVGGEMMGHGIEGITRLLALAPVPVHVQADEVPWVTRSTGVGVDDLLAHGSGDVVPVGDLALTLVHTPGHTPGSQCVLVDGKLLSGDTLFLEGCGRTDLPGGDAGALYTTLTSRLADVPDTTVLYPGHQYSAAPSATMGETRATNFVFSLGSPEQWASVFR